MPGEAPRPDPPAAAGFAAWPRWKRALVLSLPVWALFLIGEITGRLLERYAGYMPRRAITFIAPNPYLRGALVPGLRFRSGLFSVEVNAYGFRGPEFAVPKPAGTFRLFAIGESSTFGWKGVRSHVQAWPALLEAKLRAAHPDRRIEVVNAGVPGYTCVEGRINFLLRIARLEPDAILVYHGNNDLNWSWVPDVETKTVYGRELLDADTGLLNRLIDRSYVLMELRSRLDLLGRASRPKHDDPDPAALRFLGSTLRALIDDARRAGVKVAIGTFAHGLDEQGAPGRFSEDERRLGVPAVGRWFDNLSAQGARRSFPLYNAAVRALAADEKIPLAELATAIPPTPEYHSDWCHFTARGEQAAAAAWFDAVERAGWLR